MKITDMFSKKKRSEAEARELLRRYLEEKYDVQIEFRLKAYCMGYKGGLVKFFYTLDEVKEFLENPNHTSFTELLMINGFSNPEELVKTKQAESSVAVVKAAEEIKQEEQE